MTTTHLDEKQFLGTFSVPMRSLPREEWFNYCDIWGYISCIPAIEFGSFTIADNDVELVYRSGNEAFDHVLIPTTTANVYLVLVVNRKLYSVQGHRILNLNQLYGLPTPKAG